MTLDELMAQFAGTSQAELLKNTLDVEASCRIMLKGLAGSGEAMVAATAVKQIPGPHIFVLPDKEEAAYFLNDLEHLLGENICWFFPGSKRHPYQESSSDSANVLMRAEALNALSKNPSRTIVVTFPEALAEQVVTKKHLEKNTLTISKGDKLSLDFINELLFEYEFERVDFVTDPGHFSIRGGIVDIFSFSHDLPYRLEFFGDEIDSIRSFEPASQLSVKAIGRITVVPNVQDKLLKEFRETLTKFLPEQSVLWIRNYQLVLDKINKQFEQAKIAFDRLESPLNHLPPIELFAIADTISSEITAFQLVEFGTQFHFASGTEIRYNMTPQPTFRKNFELLSKNLTENKKAGMKSLIAARNARQTERLYAIFEDLQQEVTFTPMQLTLHEGFIDKDTKIACYTDHQIFERHHRFHLKEGFAESKKAITLKELTDLQSGDYVTHIDHGVGQFAGLKKIDVNGKMQEAIKLIYKDNDVVYVSIHSLHRISKFVSKEGTPPKVNKLGSKAWQNLKNKTKKKVKEIAFDLIKLYAERKKKVGFAFTPDTYLQHELEASFIFEDTPDQEKTTKAVKGDMESEVPMDRLVCGDVGFGKTEIAIRAAFKAVCDSKQVAVLAPTTILTMQHAKTFQKRLKDFPCNIAYLNRFRTAKQQRETLKDLAEGKIDIVVGTHRLIGKDVKFKDLGLMIIDEEQKFGVAAKDKLKTIKINVDTLTLTATPIPRTLQFSLMGARDLSIINTPPPNRQPVQTELLAFNEDVIREAVLYEVSRDGQVYFVHNRVGNIVEVAEMIKRLCPGVTTDIAHGQMDGPKLEDVMMRFIDGDFDVLVATSIVESGLDIPNANTMIINQANNFGLSDLHQLRGRVGRSNKKAFCYLLAPPLAALSSEAQKRLRAIEQFSELGSGFNIAMRDLDIRGAGNLLGGEQSGFISEIGFEMYQKILDEALQELRESEFQDLFDQEKERVFVKDCVIETDLEIMIPDDYVNNVTERMSLYKALSTVEEERDLETFEQKLIDRFGPLPKETTTLLDTIRLRWMAKDLGFEKIVLKQGKLICYFITRQESPYYQSAAFGQVLNYVKMHAQEAVMKERNDKLTLSFQRVRSIAEAIERLTPVLEKPAVV